MAQEKNFENAIKRYLTQSHIYRLGNPGTEPIGYWVKRHGNSYTPNGLPDLQIVIGSITIEVEIKSEKGQLSTLQKLKLEQINNSGGIGLSLRPSQFEDFKNLIERIIIMAKIERKNCCAVCESCLHLTCKNANSPKSEQKVDTKDICQCFRHWNKDIRGE